MSIVARMIGFSDFVSLASGSLFLSDAIFGCSRSELPERPG
jgi:hypothetical protein